jgi:hypothetical protein
MIVMLVRGKPIVVGHWGKGWEIQVQPVAVQSKPKRMRKVLEYQLSWLTTRLIVSKAL